MRALIALLLFAVLGVLDPVVALAAPASGGGFGTGRERNVEPSRTGEGVDLFAVEQRWSTDHRPAHRGGGGAAAREAAAHLAAEREACEERNRQLPPDAPRTICNFQPYGSPAGPEGALVDPVVVARAAVLRMPIPAPEVQVGPPPEINEWQMVAVGYPLWFWSDDTVTHAATITEQGITLELLARRRTTRFDFGDGNYKSCGVTTPWYRGVKPGAPSPGCGYVYQQPSLPQGTYAVTATTVWEVTWSALGESGTLPFERTGPPMQLPVGELHALRVG